MSKRVKQYLMLLAALGIVAVALGGGSGTFASFNARVNNDNNVFATGTLLLHQGNSLNSNICTSETDTSGNVTASCPFLIDLTNAQPGSPGPLQTAKISLANAGSIDSSDLQLAITCRTKTPTIAQLAAGDNPSLASLSDGGATTLALSDLTQTLVAGTTIEVGTDKYYVTATTTVANESSVPVKAVGSTDAQTGDVSIVAFGEDLCSNDLQLTVQEDNQNWVSGEKCVYPAAAGACSTGDVFSNFGTRSGNTGTADLTNDLWSGGEGGLHPLDAGATRYFEVTVSLPDSVSNQNALQNSEADFDLSWTIDQA
jgi:predicted ribosomally synthesized peptide with SipW-like signal peptide